MHQRKVLEAGVAGAVCFLLVACTVLPAQAADLFEDAFIGWEGESYKPEKRKDEVHPPTISIPERRFIETVSWNPRAFVYHNFLSHDEADHIINLVESTMMPSTVINTRTGAREHDPIRTSFGGTIQYSQTRVIAAIEERIADWTQLPPSHQEQMQVLRYQNGQQYDNHWDWFDHPGHFANETQENRIATIVLYLADVEEGGETAMPMAEAIDARRQAIPNPSACTGKGGIAVPPRKGDALLFWDIFPDGVKVDHATLHASCPTTKGTKWTATKWIHNRPLDRSFNPLAGASRCGNDDANCEHWAQDGLCDTQPNRMLGPTGKCRRACNDCVDCAPSDVICMRKNMRSLRLLRQASRARR